MTQDAPKRAEPGRPWGTVFERLQRWIAAKLTDIPDRIDDLEREFEVVRQEWVDFADIQARREERQKKRDLKRAKDLAAEAEDVADEAPAQREQLSNGPISKDELRRQFYGQRRIR